MTNDHSPIGSFVRRLAHLRSLLETDAAMAGDQGLKLLEEFLEYQALEAKYPQEQGSIGRYTSWLRGQGALPDAMLDQAEAYGQVRNCLAHTYGLQTSKDLAAEIIDFLGVFIHVESRYADQFMSSKIRSISEHAPLHEARNIMLRDGFSRLPVLRKNQQVIALLTDRDLVAASVQHADTLATMRVGEALPAQAKRRFSVIPADAGRDQVLEALRKPNIEALIVTRDGASTQPPLGIITHADLLYRM